MILFDVYSSKSPIPTPSIFVPVLVEMMRLSLSLYFTKVKKKIIRMKGFNIRMFVYVYCITVQNGIISIKIYITPTYRYEEQNRLQE